MNNIFSIESPTFKIPSLFLIKALNLTCYICASENRSTIFRPNNEQSIYLK